MLRRSRSAPAIDISALTQDHSVLVLTPHPDDESLGCGAAIAAASQCGIKVTVVSLTDGTGSHPNSRSYPRDVLATCRFAELITAVGILSGGIADVHSLGLPDQGVPPHTLAQNDTLAGLLSIIDARDIRTVWTTWEKDPHADHKAAAVLAQALAGRRPQIHLWRFPIWGRFIEEDLPPGDLLYKFDTAPFISVKGQAISAHASQMSDLIKDDPSGFVMEAEAQRHFLEWPEIFIRSAPQ